MKRVPIDPEPPKGVVKVLLCFTPASLAYCDYLVVWDKSHGNPKANRSEVVRRSLRAREILRHDLKGTLGNLLIVREMLLQDTAPTAKTNAGIADVVMAIHQQLARLTDPSDPEPLGGKFKQP